jgi:hypothetical protein
LGTLNEANGSRHSGVDVEFSQLITPRGQAQDCSCFSSIFPSPAVNIRSHSRHGRSVPKWPDKCQRAEAMPDTNPAPGPCPAYWSCPSQRCSFHPVQSQSGSTMHPGVSGAVCLRFSPPGARSVLPSLLPSCSRGLRDS